MQTMIQIPFTDYNYQLTTKTCVKCYETKPIQHFYREKNNIDGRRNNCKECKKARDTAFKVNKYRTNEKFRESHKATQRDYYNRMHSVAH